MPGNMLSEFIQQPIDTLLTQAARRWLNETDVVQEVCAAVLVLDSGNEAATDLGMKPLLERGLAHREMLKA